MSLLDALLLEPYRDPREVWIAIRTDGQAGSGTIDDPYDGSLIQGPQAPISSVTRMDPEENVLLVQTAYAHGFREGERVTLAGLPYKVVIKPDGTEEVFLDRYWNGNFIIYNVATTTFKIRYPLFDELPQVPTSEEATPVCYKCHARFDQVMRQLPQYAVVHLSPGDFPTLGYAGLVAGGWKCQRGQRIIGSGMGVTTLRLVHGVTPHAHYSALGADYDAMLDGFEASDFTVDCNLPSQPFPAWEPWARVACSAAYLLGSHTRLRRLRAIRWGTQTEQAECFVFFCAGSHPMLPAPAVDCVIEDCIADLPSDNNVRETSIFCMGGTFPTLHRACVIRNCIADCCFPTGHSSHYISVKSITMVPGSDYRQYWLRTRTPHHRDVTRNNIRINGVQIRYKDDEEQYHSQWSTVFNDAFPIDEVPFGGFPEGWDSATDLAFTLPVAPDGDLDAGHPTLEGNWVLGNNFHGAGADGGTAAVLEGNHVYDAHIGYYHDSGLTRDQVVRDNQFVDVTAAAYQLLGGAGAPQVGSAIAREGTTAIFTSLLPHQLQSAAQVTIRNAVDIYGAGDKTVNPYNVSTQVASVLSDTRFTYDLTSGFYPMMPNAASATLFKKPGEPDAARKLGVSLARSPGNPTLAVFTGTEPHGLSVDNSVIISGAVVNDSTSNPFNSLPDESFTVISVPDEARLIFTYRMATDPGVDVAFTAPVFKVGQSPDEHVGTALIRDGTLARFTTILPHWLLPGQGIKIQDTFVAGTLDNPFNGWFEIESVPPSPSIQGKPTSFTYRMKDVPVANASGAPKYADLWQAYRLVIENNLIELSPSLPADAARSVGINLADANAISRKQAPFVFPQAIVRGNWIRHWNDAPDERAAGIALASCEAGIVEENVVSLTEPAEFPPITQGWSSVRYFDNRTSDDRLLRGVESGRPSDELSTLVEDATLLAL